MGKKLTIGMMHEEARKKNGRCLSIEYINNRHKLMWQCEFGHTWLATPFSIHNNQWCPICGRERSNRSKRIPLENIKILVESKGGKIISGSYLDGNSKLTLQCKHNHTWTTKVSSVWHDRWCPKCMRKIANKKVSHTLVKMQKLAESKGGCCISTEYINTKTPLKWKCKHGHVWIQKPVNILRGNWCPICYRDTIEDLHNYAQKKEGKCLSKTYSTTTQKYTWKCKKNHVWDAPWSAVKKGSWCMECSGNAKKTVNELREVAIRRGGKLISDTYVNRRTPLEWTCQDGHTFFLSYMGVSSNQWCPRCHYFIGEEVVRSVLEEIFKTPFSKSYPSWLKCSTQLELDGYSPLLGLAFEHQGRQHYEYVDTFHRNGISDLYAQQERDQIKRNLCKKQNVTLFEIPEFGSMTKTIDDLETLILSLVEKSGLVIETSYNLQDISYDSIFRHIQSNIKKLQACAKEHGGKLLSKVYLQSNLKLKWECKKGHIFLKTASAVTNTGQWCPECAKENSADLHRKYTINDFKIIAKERGGLCLSEEFTNVDKKLDWQCEYGHRWSAIAYDIKTGKHWCPVCGKNQKLTIPQLRKLAKEKGGRLLSVKYSNCREKLTWICSEGHEFLMNASAVKHAHQWCPKCGDKKKNDSRRGSIEGMQEIAVLREGRCLSPTYTNSITHLRWICKRGHKWAARPDKIKQGAWCPVCRKKKKKNSPEL